jgi:rSAM/selenodomain-associated transferase 1
MSETVTQRVLGVFAKKPTPGAVKTRLASATSPAFAAEVAEALLLDTLDRLSIVAARRVVAFAPPEATVYFEGIAMGRYLTEPQSEGDLGARMARFFQHQLGVSKRAVLVGTDSPTLPVEFIEDAFERLKTVDLVLGPATDGGYYLIGCRGRNLLPIFEGVSWGRDTVLKETVMRLPADSRLELLLPWYDVDTLQDLEMMAGHLKALRRAGKDPCLVRINELLER